MNTLSLKTGIQTFSPTYFALAMSTGIICIASNMLGYYAISNWLFIINNIEFAILFVVLILRLVFFFDDFKVDLSSHSNGAGFLTIVAASCILGAEYGLLKYHFDVGIILWVFALFTWIIIVYSFFILITIKKQKPSLEKGINGSWLLFVVSVQALSILGSVISPYLNLSLDAILFINLFFYLLGLLFYFIVIGIIFYRTTFFPMKRNEFEPSYWIDMGAAAISTLAGVMLIKNIRGINEFQDYIPAIKLFSVLFWIAGTWWIPVICSLEIWRHKFIPFRYNVGYWSLVFPIGVYTVCTWQLADVLGLSFLKKIPEVSIYIAWIVWLITFIAMCFKLAKSYLVSKI